MQKLLAAFSRFRKKLHIRYLTEFPVLLCTDSILIAGLSTLKYWTQGDAKKYWLMLNDPNIESNKRNRQSFMNIRIKY